MDGSKETAGIQTSDAVPLSELFKLLADPTRIRLLLLLFDRELCVGELGMTQSAVSHQLRILKVKKLVKSRREGKQIYYALADEHVRELVATGYEHIQENENLHNFPTFL